MNIWYKITSLIIFVCFLYSKTTDDSLPSLHVDKTKGEILIDGHLDDTGWNGTAKAEGFVEVTPGENIPAIVETHAFVTYDENHLYVSFKAFDDPENIRANVSKRDNMYRDDFCGILLDTYGDANRAYQFMVNPIGIQGDGQQIGDDEDESFDMIFESAAMITDQGYQVEMAIPFSSIRFPKQDVQDWRITFFRALPRDDFRRQLVWTKIDRNNPCELCQLGYLTGIEGIKAKRSIEFLPSIVGTQSAHLDSNDVFHNEDINSDLAVGIKIPIGETTTIEVAINPDFSQVEADVTQFDVNSQFALSYPERRPFFNEGSDLFNAGGHPYMPNIKPVYTRSINDPSLAVKVLGRIGKTDYGLISAVDEETGIIVPFEDWSSIVSVGESNVNIFRLKHSLPNSSYIGGVITDKRYAGGSGTNVGTDGVYYINQNWIFNWQAFASMTTEPNDKSLTENIDNVKFGADSLTSDFDGEYFTGHQYFFQLNRNTRNSFLNLFTAEKSPTFRLDTGFLRQNHQRNLGMTYAHVWYPKTDAIEDINLSFGTGRVWNYDQEVKEKWFYSGLDLDLKGRMSVDISYLPTSESYLDSMFTGLQHLMYNLRKNFSEKFTMGFSGSMANSIIRYIDPPEKGKTRSYNIWMSFKPTDKLNFRPSINYNEAQYLDNDSYYYKGQRFRLYSTYQFNQFLSLRFIVQYFYQEDFIYEEVNKSFDIHPLLSYQPNPFTIFYIGSSHDYDEGPDGYESFDMFHNNRQIFLKFQYLFQTQ